MRRKRCIRNLIVIVMFWFPVGLQYAPGQRAQSSRADDVKAPLAQMAEELRHQFGAVRFHREEQLEERFILSRFAASSVSTAPHIFQVQAQRFELSGESVIERIPNGLPTMYVATSSDDSRAYKLAGFSSPEKEFNRLVKEGPEQEVRTEGDAASRGLLCAEIVYGLSPAWWVDGASSVKLKAAGHFFDEGHKDGLRLAEKWWESFAGNRATVRITTARALGAFAVNLPVFWAPVEGHSRPEIRVYRIEVGASGTCHMNEPAIFR